MRKDEYEERAKPMLWAMFAAASKAASNTSERAATHADELIDQFEKRFPANSND